MSYYCLISVSVTLVIGITLLFAEQQPQRAGGSLARRQPAPL